MEHSDCEINAMLKSAGLKVTTHRQDVLRVVLQHPQTPMCIDELVERLPEGFDRVTAYRIVNNFVVKGLLEKVSHLSNKLSIILSPSLRKEHQHLITCRLCGSTYTADICVQSGWRDTLAELGFSSVSHNLSFTGVCSNH